ncbi:hypothetical protein Pan44_39930 [Caulifigura coniformis]|uniref:HNH domain-containing protein n=1 Tax=Caulifigura coniformis TaxID=2527983 RepID=A0A517SIJ6_9PLAN|nr:HNH endonuclease [Caulifigura coniformis]QDT55945.1 hypothetical protein Pan44_39930 [Caulifigura coniformis]
MAAKADSWYVRGQIRDGGYCVYCGLDLLSDVGLYWAFLQNDHVVPSRGDTVENHATACACCNSLKHFFVPPGFETMSRDELIAAIREYIVWKRAEKMAEFHERRRLCGRAPLDALPAPWAQDATLASVDQTLD